MFWRKSNGRGDTGQEGREGREDMEKSGISPTKNWGNLGFNIQPAKNWDFTSKELGKWNFIQQKWGTWGILAVKLEI